ncbi:MAG: peptide chain release factor N(5)-glutamine methyltransferase [Dysgonamonadaceae bacterium]|jgi:release factor glutamine methyltransferase|nr:peptide chain release factor N(5)-glutamine methyltransferase [Dysgonamonadaceae bacterium]
MQAIYNLFRKQLQELYLESEIREFYFLISEKMLGIDKQDIFCGQNHQLSDNKQILLCDILADLKLCRPIQYIIGETEFYGLPFKVNEYTLIPRPETEELVEIALNSMKGGETILDIGTGSGCIAVTIAKRLPSAIVYAIDISKKALEIASKNAALNGVNVRFIQIDVLKELPKIQFDIIVSNPPYVTPAERQSMHRNVLDYEPQEALFVPQDNPLLFYRRIAEIGLTHLTKNGQLFFEINPLYANELQTMLNTMGYNNIQLHKDISGKDRVISLKTF